MSCEDFIKNNRGINDGADMPEEYMAALYGRITTNEIKVGGSRRWACWLAWCKALLWPVEALDGSSGASHSAASTGTATAAACMLSALVLYVLPGVTQRTLPALSFQKKASANIFLSS